MSLPSAAMAIEPAASSQPSFGPVFRQGSTQGGEKGSKRRREQNSGASGGDRELAKQVLEIAKLATHSAAEVRSLRAITTQCLLLPSDSRLATMMVSAQQQYATATKGRSGHGQGIPEHWSWKAAVAALREHYPLDAKEGAFLKAHEDGLLSPASMRGKVGACKCSSAYGENKSRIDLVVAPEYKDVLLLLCAYVETIPGGEVREGRPPRGHQERVVSDLIDRLKKL